MIKESQQGGNKKKDFANGADKLNSTMKKKHRLNIAATKVDIVGMLNKFKSVNSPQIGISSTKNDREF